MIQPSMSLGKLDLHTILNVVDYIDSFDCYGFSSRPAQRKSNWRGNFFGEIGW